MKKVVLNFIPLVISLIATWIMVFNVVIKCKLALTIAICSTIIILLLKVLYELVRNYSADDRYNTEKKDIIKTYGFILTKLDAIPNLKEYTYYKYDKLSQIIAKAMDSRVNIYYVYDENTCDFFLIDQGCLYIYTIKKNSDYFSRIDEYFVEAQRAI